MLGGILPMVLQGLVKAELSVSSVSTLKRICRECRFDLGPYAQDILSVSQVGRSDFCLLGCDRCDHFSFLSPQDALLKEIHKVS